MVSTLLDSLLVAPDTTEKFTLSTPGVRLETGRSRSSYVCWEVRSHKQQKTLFIERHPFSLVPSILISMHFAACVSWVFVVLLQQ